MNGSVARTRSRTSSCHGVTAKGMVYDTVSTTIDVCNYDIIDSGDRGVTIEEYLRLPMFLCDGEDPVDGAYPSVGAPVAERASTATRAKATGGQQSGVRGNELWRWAVKARSAPQSR